MKRGTPGQNGWTYSLDGDPIHPDWEWTLDYDYEPKGTTITPDGDKKIPQNASTSHLRSEHDDSECPWL